jgi:hypothetical protein
VCRTPIEVGTPDRVRLLEELVSRTLPASPPHGSGGDDAYFLIVARGHRNLLDQLQAVLGEMGWIRIIEDRRRDETLLPREGRAGKVFTIE